MDEFNEFFNEDEENGVTADLNTSEEESLGEGKLPVNPITPKGMVDSILRVYTKLGAESWLLSQAESNPKEFLQILKVIIPKDAADLPSDRPINIILAPAPGHENAPNRAEVINLVTNERPEQASDPSTPEGKAVNISYSGEDLPSRYQKIRKTQ